MTGKTILILGGYGNTGLAIARLCLEHTDARLILAGRNQSRAVEAAAEINGEFTRKDPTGEGFRVFGVGVDASNEDDLKRALVGGDLLVVASSTAKYTQEVASAALAVGVGAMIEFYETVEDAINALITQQSAKKQ